MSNTVEFGGIVFVIVIVITATHATGQGNGLMDKIYPVDEAKLNEYPFTVSVMGTRFGNTFYLCTGTIVDRQWVLTAAQCLYPFYNVSYVVAGVYDKDTGEGDTQLGIVEETYIHPNFSDFRYFSYDIGLIRLQSRLRIRGDAVQTTPLMRSKGFMRKVLANEKKCVMLGWGLLYSELTEASRLNELAVQFVDDDTASARGYRVVENNINIEAAYKDECRRGSPCSGDEGGPVVCRKGGTWLMTGIYSFGNVYDGCITGVKTAVNILSFVDLIDSYIS